MPPGDVRGSYDPGEAGRQNRAAETRAGINRAERRSDQLTTQEAEALKLENENAAARDRLNRDRFATRYQADAVSVEPKVQAARAEAVAIAGGKREFRAPEAQSGMVEVSPLSTQSETARIKESIKPPERPQQPAAKPKKWFGLFG
jgi:hypothetical protein